MGSNVNWRGFWIGLIVAVVALSVSLQSFDSATSGGGGYVIFWGAVLWGGWKALTSLGGAGKPKPITLSDYGMECLRNLLRAFITESGREPTDRQQRYLAQAAAFMQYNHDDPPDMTLSTPGSVERYHRSNDLVNAIEKGLYGRELNSDEHTKFALMIANAYPRTDKGKAQGSAPTLGREHPASA